VGGNKGTTTLTRVRWNPERDRFFNEILAILNTTPWL